MLALSLYERDDPARDKLLARVRGEFKEMPGLRLNVRQAHRLWGLDLFTCEDILAALVDEGVLTCTHNSTYVVRHGRA
jgi:hypothetical protein